MSKKNVTFVITDEQNKNVEISAAVEGKQKSEIVTEALIFFLSQKPYKSILSLDEEPNEDSSKSATTSG